MNLETVFKTVRSVVSTTLSSSLISANTLIWYNEELLLVLSFLLFCFMVHFLVEVRLVEFVAERNVQTQQHAFVAAKEYLLRDLRKQKESQQVAGLIVVQVVKAFLVKSVAEVSRLKKYIQFNNLQAATASVTTIMSAEQRYVETLTTAAFSSVQSYLENELVSQNNLLLTTNLLKIYFNINTSNFINLIIFNF